MNTHLVCPHCNSTNRVATDQLEAELSCGSCRKPLFDKHPASLTSIGLAAQIAKSEVPVVVDFWAPWCGPCKLYGPKFEKFAEANAARAKFVKVNVEDAEDIASQFGVQSIPTTIFFKDGKEAAREVGITYSQFANALRKAAIEIDRKMLADLAVHDKAAFGHIVDQVKARLAA